MSRQATRRRFLPAVGGVLALVLLVGGSWMALRIGPEGQLTASRTLTAGAPVVLNDAVLSASPVPVRVRAAGDQGTEIFLGVAPADDVSALLGSGRRSTIPRVGPLATTLPVSTNGVGTVQVPWGSDSWEQTARGPAPELQVEPGRPYPRQLLVGMPADAGRSVTVTALWADPSWFVQSLLVAGVGGLTMLGSAVAARRTAKGGGTPSAPDQGPAGVGAPPPRQPDGAGPDRPGDQEGRRERSRRTGTVAALSLLLAGCGMPGIPGSAVGHPSAAGQLDPAGAVVGSAHAEQIIARVGTRARGLGAAPGSTATPNDPAAVYTREALRAVQARLTLTSRGIPETARFPLVTGQLAAVTRTADRAFPRLILVAEPAGATVSRLHLLVADNIRTPYRIAWSATVQAGQRVPPLPAVLATGEPPGGRGLTPPPSALLNAYAAGLTRLADHAPYLPDEYAKKVRGRALAMAEQHARDAKISQTHRALSDSVWQLPGEAGSGLVLGVVERTVTVAVRPGRQLALPAEFAALAGGRRTVVDRARFTTLVFVALWVPGNSPARLLAVAEQPVAAAGH